ncbi:conserved protein of unknown function [Candidatus Filomicrobium marinum]|uniref:AAA+ ATPase domain-containing protein n=2 Tax=Candidatus Filomicrobium marinum TaxID=1608628 RepID=A0A0D6JEB7_9HYPH|nr:conserved protein of unknown function [Candidatus Filomicrobium marinum]CPR18328.1 conserved protein of unknown function [Candidatus Filomicrobium marinum]
MVFAPTGIGKSWFAMGVTAAVASGGTYGHWSAPEPRKVLYIDGEMDAADLKSRFHSIVEAAASGDRDAIEQNVLLYARHDQPEDGTMPDFGDPDDIEGIVQIVRDVRPDLVVLDNLSTLATVDDNNASEAWDPFLKLLQRIRSTGAAVLVVHHANKGGETYHGSSKIPVMFDSLVRLRPNKSPSFDKVGAAFILDFVKLRMLSEDANKTFDVAFSDNQWHFDTVVSPEVLQLVQRILGGEFTTQKDAAAALGTTPVDVTRMLSKAYAAGVTTRDAIKAALQQAQEDADEEADLPF